MNRFVWNLRYPGAVRVPGNKTAGEASEGPYVLPGYYQVRLTVGDQQATEFFEVVNDPRVQTSLADLAAQQQALFAIRDKISAAHRGGDPPARCAGAGGGLAETGLATRPRWWQRQAKFWNSWRRSRTS